MAIAVAKRMGVWARNQAMEYRPLVKVKERREGKAHIADAAMSAVQNGLAKIKDELLLVNLRARLVRLQRAHEDAEFAAAEDAECRGNFLYWLEWYGWTFDPRLKDAKTLPFIPFELQRELAHYVQGLRDDVREGVVEKSRDMGATWMIVAYFVWCWLYEEGFTGLFASRKVELVDKKGDPKSIFEKARQIIRTLPKWMLPLGFQMSKHSIRLKIVNPQNGATLTGEGGHQIGRGGRASMVLIDEAAFLEQPDSVDSALSETSDVKIWLSTPHRPGDNFAQKRFSGDFVVFTMHWKRDPRKNGWVLRNPDGTVFAQGHGDNAPPGAKYAWYERAKTKLADPVKLAREVDIDYDAATEGVVCPAVWVRACVNLELDPGTGGAEYGLDTSGQGPDKEILCKRIGPVVLWLREIKGGNSTLKARTVARIVEQGIRGATGQPVVHYDAGGGFGEGFRGEIVSGGVLHPFRINGVLGGGGASKRRWKSENKRANELFRNMRTELYWQLRERFKKGYELWLYRSGDPDGFDHPEDECISIPNDPELIAQLPLLLYEELSSGKVGLEPKEKLKERMKGRSPDYADALAFSFAPEPKPSLLLGTQNVASTG